MSRDATPLMQQYHEIKAQHANAILLFRMGDFYETFYDDAETAARVLGLTLTSRNNGGAAEVPLAGVPVKAVTEYLRRLVQHGFRVAICEQIEDPRLTKGIVRRAVVETVTPGAAFEDELLDGQRHNFLCALRADGEALGIAAADVSTGAFRLALVPAGDAAATVARFAPREVLVARGSGASDVPGAQFNGVLVTEREEWEFDPVLAREELTRRFAVHSLEGLGLAREADAAIGAAGALLRYLGELQPGGIPHLMPPRLEQAGTVMPLDEMTRRNLELVEPLRGDTGGSGETGGEGRAGTLLAVLDRSRTAMGARLLREWILAPLRRHEAIEDRLAAVDALVGAPVVRATLRDPAPQVRAHAADAVAKIEGERAIDVLVAALADPDHATRLRALEAFETMRVEDTSPLEAALRDPNAEVRRRDSLAPDAPVAAGALEGLLKSECARLLTAEAGFAPHERIARVALLDEPLTVENGLLTGTLKVKRQAVLERHAGRVDALFGGDE